jgi:hypothetical protein
MGQCGNSWSHVILAQSGKNDQAKDNVVEIRVEGVVACSRVNAP